MSKCDLHLGSTREYKTLAEAIDAAKRVLAGTEQVDVRILADGEEYTVGSTQVLTASGHPDSTLTLTASGEEKPTVTGLCHFSGAEFQPVSGKPYSVYQLPDSARDENREFPQFRDLYVNGRRARLARIRENSFLPFDHVEKLSWAQRRGNASTVNKLYIEEKFLDEMTVDCDPMPEFWVRTEWQIHGLHITGIDRNDRCGDCVAVSFPVEEWREFSHIYCTSLFGRPYWLSNHLSLLTEENDFYYDRKNGRIYYIPAADCELSKATCGYPAVENLFTLDGFSHMRFENIRFTGTTTNYVTNHAYEGGQCGSQGTRGYTLERSHFITNAAVFGENCTDISFDGCEFFEIGNDAIYFRRRTKELSVVNSRFERIGSAAFRVGSPVLVWDDVYDGAEHLTFEHNYVDEVGLTYTSSAAVIVTHALYVSISHNTLKNTCYSAVSVGWSWALSDQPMEKTKNLAFVEIAYNYIDNFMYCMRDGGAIYTLGGNAYQAERRYLNSIHHNYMIVGETSGEAMNGYRTIYHDNGSSHWHDYDNVILAREDNPPRDAFIIGGSMYDLVERTYILDYAMPTPHSVYRPDGEGKTMEIEEVDTDRSVSTSALPEAVAAIIRATGCHEAAPALPLPHVHKDTYTLTAKDSAELASALIEARTLLKEGDAVLTLTLGAGEYAFPSGLSLPLQGYNSLAIVAKDGATVTEPLSILGVRNLSIEGLRFAAPITLHDAENVKLTACRFEAPVKFSGYSLGVSLTDSHFADIDGDALSFGDGKPHTKDNACEHITVSKNRFEAITGAGIVLATVKNLFVRKNLFKNVGLEAVRLGVGDREVDWPSAKPYNVLSAVIGENRIEGYMLRGDGAAIATTGGNRSFYHQNPFNVIEKNYIVPTADTGIDGGYSVFYHGGCASQWHTRFNVIAANAENPAKGALCRFVGAYASWADENTVLTDREIIFCDPAEILPARDLHDKLTYFVKPSEMSERVKETVENAGK